MSMLVRRKRMIISVVIGTMILVAGITLLIPNKYVSTATILPSGGQDKMAELKSLAGLSSLTDQDDNSSQLFPVILRSNTIQDAVLNATYDYNRDGRDTSIVLSDYFEQANPDKLRKALTNITSVSLDKKTGVISLGVETEYPTLSRAILTRYLDELESFNLYKRRTQAGERATYLKRELADCKADLAEAEDSLAAFQAVNRGWETTSDPEVLVLLGRLQRDVETRNQKYLYLVQEFEIAKLDSRKDVPVVRILDNPSLPAQKSSPKRTAYVLLAGIFAAIMSVFGVMIVEAVRRSSQGPDRESFEELRSDLSSGFPRIRQAINRLAETAKG
jgi:uncharacterized protein involved in exopolysaccharide biosynthesis